MEKEEAVKLLNMNGYNAIIDKGVPTLTALHNLKTGRFPDM